MIYNIRGNMLDPRSISNILTTGCKCPRTYMYVHIYIYIYTCTYKLIIYLYIQILLYLFISIIYSRIRAAEAARIRDEEVAKTVVRTSLDSMLVVLGSLVDPS